MATNLEILEEVEEFVSRFPDVTVLDVIYHVEYVFGFLIRHDSCLHRAISSVRNGASPEWATKVWLR